MGCVFVVVGCAGEEWGMGGWLGVGLICIIHIWSLTLFPRGILIFQGVLTELNLFDENKRLKI